MSKTLIVDADTLLYSSAAQQQENKCRAIHKASGRDKLFESKTAFNTWLKSQEKWDKDEFEFQTESSVVGEARFAFQAIKQKVEKIFNASYCDDFILCIEGEGNFRRQYQTPYVQYKANRTEKPILFEECREFFQKKYKNKIVLAEHRETDDVVNIMAWESYTKALSTRNKGNAQYVIAYVDKDIVANGRGFMINYNKLEDGVFWNDNLTQTRKFFAQCLQGDNADNIPGIKFLADITKERYGISVKGVGPATVDRILGECKTEKEMGGAVVQCYQEAYPEDWWQRLQDNAFFLYLQRKENDVFQLDEFLGGLK